MKGEQYSTSRLICPFCKYEQVADEGFYFDESLTEYECPACDKKYDVSVSVQWSWTTGIRQTLKELQDELERLRGAK